MADRKEVYADMVTESRTANQARGTRAALPTSATKRAAIYVRVSTVEQEELSSLTTQEQRCREFAVGQGYVVGDGQFYREVHSGAELWERPQLTRLRDAIRHRQVDAVIVYAIDRLSRDPVHLGVVFSEADHAGVPVDFVSEPLDNTPEGQLIRFIRGYAAQIEREKIKERTQRGKLARAQSGKLVPGCRALWVSVSWRQGQL